VLTLLKRADMEGKPPVPFSDLQAQLGIGTTDLMVSLELLVQEGSAQRHDDGAGGHAYAAVMEAPGPEPVPPIPAHFAEGESATAPAPTATDLSPLREVVSEVHLDATRGGEPVVVVLTAAIVQGMHPEVVGAMVLAGIESAEGREFVLRVLP
jgi:hypothetical protein